MKLSLPITHSPDALHNTQHFFPLQSPFASPGAASPTANACALPTTRSAARKALSRAVSTSTCGPASPATSESGTGHQNDEALSQDRPTVKRRKTAPELSNQTSAPAIEVDRVGEEQRTKSGSADVWVGDVEDAFMEGMHFVTFEPRPHQADNSAMEAIRLIPRLGRRKVLVNGKSCGRNELIADYVCQKTGQARTRKQVSSHIQVFKLYHRGNPESESFSHRSAQGPCLQ